MLLFTLVWTVWRETEAMICEKYSEELWHFSGSGRDGAGLASSASLGSMVTEQTIIYYFLWERNGCESWGASEGLSLARGK